ncbi:hypothetical protein NA56DRAFT_566586 [Hyaloscypha hepaticicola]|uniref:RBR-type E3 ubiquitin transferase n=1 Tax=Hyaloscypha hepaticicola TaxID=2082293 RepID=A0A2J6QEG3_9HELO|nr:hypothetical protein NA56DRAFT_566586 [Hyaloscypha hepaticicola]
MDRGALYTSLFELAKELDEDETRNIENWLKNGGEFPSPAARSPPQAQAAGPPADIVEDEDEEGEWPEYHLEDFETGSSEANGDMNEDAENSEEEDEDDDSHASAIDMHRAWPDEEEDDSEVDHMQMDHRARRAHLRGKSSGEMIECSICADEFDKTEFPETTQITSNCHHKSDDRVCIYCLQQSIATAVTEGQLHLVICPFCPEKLSHNEVKKYATKEVFARYEYLKLMATPDLVMCLGLDCGSGQIHPNASENPMMICEACSFKTCAVHKLPWHEGQTCEEFDMDDSQIERLEEAEATAKLLAKEHAQVCPNCLNGVSRIDGCDHMTCKKGRCGNEWCYVCGASYEKIKAIGEEAHAVHCMYHPRRVNMRRDQERAAQGQLTQMVHGGPISEALEQARGRRNERVRAELRPLAAQAAERRMREMEQQKKEEEKTGTKKRKLNLHAPWEET